MLSAEDQWSETPSSKRYSTSSRSYDEFQKSSTATCGQQRFSHDDSGRSVVTRMDPRLDYFQNGTHRDRRRRSTDDETCEIRGISASSRTRVTGAPDDHLERMENVLRRASSLRRDIMLDDLERSSTRRDSRRSSFESDRQQIGGTPPRDAASLRGTPAERGRVPARQASQGGHSDRATRDEDEESRLATRRVDQQAPHEAPRDRESVSRKESSLQRRYPLDDSDNNAKRSCGRSPDAAQNPRKTPSKETPMRRREDSEDRDLPGAIDDLQLADRRRSLEKDQRSKDAARTTSEVQQRRQDSADDRQPRVSQSRSKDQAAKKPDTIEDAEKMASNETAMEIPKEEWACEHCTFINKINDRVCVVCCKTRSSALPPSTLDDDRTIESISPQASEGSSRVADPEKRTRPLRVSNSEESGDSGSVKNKGRPRRKISFSFGTKLSK